MQQVDNKTLSTWERIKDSDIYHSFIKSPTAIASSTILFIIFFYFSGTLIKKIDVFSKSTKSCHFGTITFF